MTGVTPPDLRCSSPLGDKQPENSSGAAAATVAVFTLDLLYSVTIDFETRRGFASGQMSIVWRMLHSNAFSK